MFRPAEYNLCIICEPLADGAWRLTGFHYVEGARFAGNGRYFQVVTACDALLQTEVLARDMQKGTFPPPPPTP